MLTPRETEIVLDVLAPYADRIDAVRLFGSRALGTARPASDIDLALYGDLDERTMARLWSLFDQSGLAVIVDLIDYARLAHQGLKTHIDLVGRPLFSRDDLCAARPRRVAS